MTKLSHKQLRRSAISHHRDKVGKAMGTEETNGKKAYDEDALRLPADEATLGVMEWRKERDVE